MRPRKMLILQRLTVQKLWVVIGLSSGFALWPLGVASAHSGLPGQGSIWSAWLEEPWLLLLLGAASLGYLRGVTVVWKQAGVGRGIQRLQVLAYGVGTLILFIAMLSPLDHLAHESFAFHMVQHILLILVAAPLFALGAPHLAYLWAMPAPWRRTVARGWQKATWLRFCWAGLTNPAVVWVLHTLAFWVWHVPLLYEAALVNPWLHGLEHFSFFATALLFWWLLGQVGVRRRMGYGVALLYIFSTMIQGTVLGALLTFAPTVWYPMQTLAGSTVANLTPLEDQQLAGVIMWIPSGPIYLAVFLWFMARWLRAADDEAARPQHPIWATMRQPTLEGD